VAIKGKGRTRSRAPARAPRPEPVAVKPPVFARRWVVSLVSLAAGLGLAAFGIWAKTPGVRWVGVTVAALNAIAQLLFIDAYPFWSLALFTIDILVIYGLVAHGKRSLA